MGCRPAAEATFTIRPLPLQRIKHTCNNNNNCLIAYTVNLSLKVHKERVVQATDLILFMPFIPRKALVVVEFYPWFTFYFLCFKLIISPITIPQTNAKENKI